MKFCQRKPGQSILLQLVHFLKYTSHHFLMTGTCPTAYKTYHITNLPYQTVKIKKM